MLVLPMCSLSVSTGTLFSRHFSPLIEEKKVRSRRLKKLRPGSTWVVKQNLDLVLNPEQSVTLSSSQTTVFSSGRNACTHSLSRGAQTPLRLESSPSSHAFAATTLFSPEGSVSEDEDLSSPCSSCVVPTTTMSPSFSLY